MQDKNDADKIKIGDGIMNLRSEAGNAQKCANDGNESSSESYFSSNDDEDSTSASDSDDDDEISSNSTDSDKQQKVPFIIAQPAPNSVSSSTASINQLFNTSDSYNHSAPTSVPQRKPPSTNLRRYTVEEVNLIRKLIEDSPDEEAKVLFAKFRQKFPCWNDDTEAYTKFYQKKWRICKEQQSIQNKKRSRNAFDDGAKQQQQPQNMARLPHQPPFKKYKVTNTNNALPPPLMNNQPKQEQIAFNASIMPKLPFVETQRSNGLKQEKDAFVVSNATINPLSLPIIPNNPQQQQQQNQAIITPLNEVNHSETVKNEILPPALPPPPGNK